MRWSMRDPCWPESHAVSMGAWATWPRRNLTNQNGPRLDGVIWTLPATTHGNCKDVSSDPSWRNRAMFAPDMPTEGYA
eukprot:2518896-Pyramimonas_sp.AAC.1